MTPDSFIRKMCHDVRAPIRAMKELPNWLEEDLQSHGIVLPDAAQETLGMMKTQATRLDRLIEDLHDFAKLARSDAPALTNLEALVRSAPWADQIDCEFAATDIAVEPAHAEIIVHHLVDNAFKHARAQEKRALLSSRIEGNSIRVSVSDRGPGIAREYRGTVYEPLTTLKPRDDCEGSGMGLAFVARIAALYGGSCDISANRSGPGVCSSVRLPLR